MTAPSPVDLELFDHAPCTEAAELYGMAFCVATHKPGVCKGAHRSGTTAAPAKVVAPPKAVPVPNAPAAKTDAQRIAQEQAAASYTAALQHAQGLAQQLGLKAGSRRGAQTAVRDYAHALHQHGQAIKAEDSARTHAQKAHDTAQARNAAAQAHYVAQVARAKAKAHAVAKHAALKKAVHVAQFPLTYPSPAGFASQGWAAEADLYALPGAEFEEVYALVAASHWMCGVDQFCRNPLHPGPCKGWKHTLHAVAPGAYHAYEKDRVDKANANRVAKIKALQALGSPVPKSLLKEITYSAPTKPQAGFIPPTPKEAVAALPATKAEIGAKLDLKHAAAKQAEQADAAKKLHLQHAALINSAEALGTHPNASAVKKKMIDIAASQKAKGEPLTAHPIMQATIKGITEATSAKAGGLHGDEKAKIQKDIADHVEAGATGIPGSIKSVLEAHKAKQEASSVAIEKSAHQSNAKTFLEAYDIPGWAGATGSAKTKALENLSKIVVNEHTTPGQKAKAQELIDKIIGPATSGKQAPKNLSAAEVKDRIHKAYLEAVHPDSNWVMLSNIRSNPLLKDVSKEQVDAALKDMLKNHGEHFDIIPESNQKVLTQPQKDAAVKIGNQDQHLISIDEGFDAKAAGGDSAASKPKATGALAHPDMMEAAGMAAPGSGFTHHEKLVALQQPGVTKAEFEKLGPVGQEAVKNAIGAAHAANHSPVTTQAIANKLGLGHPALLGNQPITGEHPDGAKFVQALNDAKTTGQKFDVIDTQLTKKMYDAMPPAAKKQVQEALAAMQNHKPELAQAVAISMGILLPHVSPGASSAGLSGHVKAAHDAAVGGVYATDTAKLQHYGALSPAEFKSLPAPARQKILEDLAGMHDKFLSPQKTGKAKTLHDSFHAAHLAAAPSSGAGGSGGSVAPSHAAGENLVDSMVEAHNAVRVLALGTGVQDPAALKSVYLAAVKNGGLADQVGQFADGLSASWIVKNFDHVVPKLTSMQMDGLHDKAASEMKGMIVAGATEPPAGGVLDAYKKGTSVSDILAAAGSPVPGTPQAGAGTPSGITPAQHAAAHDAVNVLAKGVKGSDKTVLYEKYPAGENADDIVPALSKQWTELHDLNALGLTSVERTHIQAQAAQEMKQMILEGKTTPPVSGVLGAAIKAHGTDQEKAAALKAAASLKAPKAAGLGKGTTLKGLSEGHQQEILGAFKMQPKGAQLSEPVEESFKSALNVAHGLSGQPGMGKLSLLQVLKSIDAQHSKNLGVTNSGLLEQKVTSWLASADGKAFAKSAKPDPAVVQALGSGIQLPPGAKIGKGEKVQKAGGPGKFDAKVSSDRFLAYDPHQAQAEQDAYMAKTGETWTPAQSAALTSYTIASGSMNGYLRGESSADPSTKQSIIEAQAGMRPLTNHHLLRRGTGFAQLPVQYRSHEGAKAMIGKTISEPAFLSTSVSSGGFPGDGLVLEIEAPPGTMGAYVDGISKFPGEYEMLLAAGTKMRVIGVRDEYGTTVMRVRVVS